jgi:hypothetical protein
MFFRTRKRIARLEHRIDLLQSQLLALRMDFNSRYGKAIDKQFEFDEILECVDDILRRLDDNHIV